MKISKLFHWMYAVLMLLPVFAIGATCLYAVFNENAYQSYDDYNNNLESTINVTNFNDLVDNTNAFLIINYDSQYDSTDRNSYRVYFNNLTINNNTYQTGYFMLGYRAGEALGNFLQIFDNNNVRQNYYNIIDIKGSYQFYYLRSEQTNSYYNQNNMYGSSIAYFVISTEVGKVSDVFYHSIDKVKESPLFNWAYDSFLATPITYVTALFGIANDHIAVMLMSYWLAISVIWLVFDLVMYVPLLVHRWIDKGVLE